MKLGAGGKGKGLGPMLYIIGAAACALLAGAIHSSYLRSLEDTTPVYVAARDLNPGMVLTARDLTKVDIPTAAVPKGAVQDVDQAVGKRMKTALIQGDILREGHFTDASNDVSAQLAHMGDEYRALMLPADILPAANRLQPGDYIELTAVLPVMLPGREDPTQSAVFVTHGTVVDVVKDSDDKVLGIILAVHQDDVGRIALALRVGTVTAAFLPAGVEPKTPDKYLTPLDEFVTSVPGTTRAPTAPPLRTGGPVNP